ncbi:MAG: Coenzyme A disulfide reductase [Candidatus Woesearchaeota archaeon]|nr:Coenzyme A disulfide reductase [Candidatus Woesearchaeota archaeon]
MNIVIIGNGTAGVTTALEIRKKNKQANIKIFDKSGNLPYSRCSLPYLVSGKIQDSIQTFDRNFYKQNNLKIINAEVKSINRQEKVVKTDKDNYEYDKLVLATGAKPFVPDIAGLKDYYTLHTIKHAQELMKASGKGVIIGAGMVGVELADSLRQKCDIVLLEAKEHVLSTILDKNFAKIVEKKIKNLRTSVNIKKIDQNKVYLKDEIIDCDFIVVACGVKANSKLAKESGLKVRKGIIVDKQMKTSDKDIYACGDCAQTNAAKLATNAIMQAEVVADNILGIDAKIKPSFNTCITKFDNFIIGSTGDLGSENTISAVFRGKARAEYYPKNSKVYVKLIAKEDYLVGAQLIGEEDVVGRINWLALAVQQKLKIEQLCDAETAYNPALSCVFDPVVVAANILKRKISR